MNRLAFSTLSVLALSSISIIVINNTKALSSTPMMDEPLCYMQTNDGRTLNLGKLCSQQPIATAPGGHRGVTITRMNVKGKLLDGLVTNYTGKSVKSVKVNYEVLDSEGNFLDAGFIDAQPGIIPPGGTASFQKPLNFPGATVQTTYVLWE